MSAPSTGPQPEPPTAAPSARRYSRGGLIAAGILTAWCLAGVILGREGGGSSWFACFAANAFLFWRSFRPPLSFGQGFAVWFGGMIAGLAVTALQLPLLPAIGMAVFFVAIGGGLIRLGWNPPPRGGAKVVAGVAIVLVVLAVLAAVYFSLGGRRKQPQRAPAVTQPQ